MDFAPGCITDLWVFEQLLATSFLTAKSIPYVCLLAQVACGETLVARMDGRAIAMGGLFPTPDVPRAEAWFLADRERVSRCLPAIVLAGRRMIREGRARYPTIEARTKVGNTAGVRLVRCLGFEWVSCDMGFDLWRLT